MIPRTQALAGKSSHQHRGQRLTELIARDLQQQGARPRQAWRYAAELSQREATERFNQVSGNPRARMSGNRIGDYEQWPIGGVRHTLPVLRILAESYGTTWDQLVDASDLPQTPEGDRLEYLEKGLGPPPSRSQLAPRSVDQEHQRQPGLHPDQPD